MNNNNLAAVLLDIEQEENVQDQVMLNFANLAAILLLEMEDGIPPDNAWVTVTVDIEEYRRMGDPCFAMHFRMPIHTFEELVQVIGNHLVNGGRWRRSRTPISHILLMVLWLMATPDSFRSVSLRFGVRPGTLYFHYVYIIEALRELAHTYIRWPNRDEREEIKLTFQRSTESPGIVGCVDCTHVFVTKPVDRPEAYRNRHHSYSLTTQAIVDNHLIVRDLYVGEPGSLHDSRTFRRSPVYKYLLQDVQNVLIRPDEHLVGDGAYPTLHFMMTPFSDNGHRTRNELKYNTKLSQCCVRVEHCFGLAEDKWRRLKFLHAMNQRNVVDHITASFVLHNFVVLHGQPLVDEDDLAQPVPNVWVHENNEDDNEVEEPAGHEHPLLGNARRRGEEKRNVIVHHVIPTLDD